MCEPNAQTLACCTVYHFRAGQAGRDGVDAQPGDWNACGQNFDYNVTLSAVDYTLPGAEVVGETTSSRFESSVCSRKGSTTFARAARQST